MIKCVVIDDELLARKLLESYISKLPNLELLGVFKGAKEAMPLIEKEQVDLLFLDIQMPDINGVDFLKSLEVKPSTIFTTAYSEYAIEAYNLNVIDYLLKPIPFDRFVQSIDKASEQVKTFKDYKRLDNKEYIVLKSTYRLHKVNYSEILSIEGLKEYVAFHLKGGEQIITLESLKKLDNNLPDNFMRIHRSHIINKDHVKTLYGNMVEIENKKIDIGKTYKDKVIKELF